MSGYATNLDLAASSDHKFRVLEDSFRIKASSSNKERVNLACGICDRMGRPAPKRNG